MMRILVHLSDIHFGSVDPSIVKPLIEAVRKVAPDVVVVSGDLTQRARGSQFIEAREFLARLPGPQVVVPGNHDIPLYDVISRFISPLRHFRSYITDTPEPYYVDKEIAVLGINTARSLTFKNGRISHEQISLIRDHFCLLDPEIIKILVTHHPVDLPRGYRVENVVGRAAQLLDILAYCGADLLLAGHYHVSHTGDTAARYPIPGYTALVVHAGTAASFRGRGELNSFNVIRIERPFVSIDRHTWLREIGAFEVSQQERFQRNEKEWVRRTRE